MRETIRSFSRTIFLFTLLSLLSITNCHAEGQAKERPAYDLKELEFAPGLSWLNVSRPLTMADLYGKVVILDFWTYGCINCLHVLADLKRLEEKYGHQLLVISVHTPKFDNEKNLETLRINVFRYGIEHPVVNDVDFLLANYYGMRAWPTRVLIDPAGSVFGRITGEGRYDLLDETIGQLLEKHKAILDPAPIPLKLEKEQLAASLLAAPGKIAISKRHVAISDTLHNRVIVTDHQGNIQQIYGGKSAGKQDGNNITARFNAPQGVAFDEHGLFVADTGNHLIRYIDLDTATVKSVAGNGSLERKKEGEFDALSVGLASPWALALHANQLYIAMAGSHQIWRYNRETEKIGPYAGSGREGIDDGELPTSTFSQPSGLSISGDWLYIADSEDSAVRRIHLQEERVETLIGTGLFDFGDRDGVLKQAQLQHVLGVAGFGKEQLLITDTYNHKLKSIDLKQGVIKTLLGNGKPGSTLNSEEVAQLNEPGGLALLGSQVLIADTNNHRIVAFNLETGVVREWKLTEKR